MAFGAGPGIITDGPGADSYRNTIPLRVALPGAFQIFNGQAYKRNYSAVVGRNDTYPQFSLGDQASLATSPNAGFVAGVYNGPSQQNTNNAAALLGVGVTRLGQAKVRVAVLNGGTAVAIGSIVGFSAAVGASTLDVPTVQGSYAPGAGIGYVVGYQVTTALAASLLGIGSQTIAVANTTGITTATALTIDYGQASAEAVTPTAVVAQVKSSGNITVGGTFSAGTILTAVVNGVSTSYTIVSGDVSLAGAATSFAKAINASTVVQGLNAVVGPSIASAALVYFSSLGSGTSTNSITLATSAVGGTTTAVASGALFTGGLFGTITAPFQFTHGLGATIIGQTTAIGSVLIPVPAATGGINVDIIACDVALIGA